MRGCLHLLHRLCTIATGTELKATGFRSCFFGRCEVGAVFRWSHYTLPTLRSPLYIQSTGILQDKRTPTGTQVLAGEVVWAFKQPNILHTVPETRGVLKYYLFTCFEEGQHTVCWNFTPSKDKSNKVLTSSGIIQNTLVNVELSSESLSFRSSW